MKLELAHLEDDPRSAVGAEFGDPRLEQSG